MKSFLAVTLLICMSSIPALAANPRIAGAFVELREAPLFEAAHLKLAPTWGSSLPIGDEFTVEKVYGRWLYGKPTPLAKMKAKDYAPAGWVYSRMLLMPDDLPTMSKAESDETHYATYYSLNAWHLLGLNPQEESLSTINFLESLMLSQKTMRAFRGTDEKELGLLSTPIIFSENAAFADDKKPDSLGLVGADLSFLKEEYSANQNQKAQKENARRLKLLKAPKPQTLTAKIKDDILGRYMIYKYFNLPKLTHEEVDGYIYMRAVALRALEGCSPKIQKFWQNKRWAIFRILDLKSRPEDRNPWLQLELPGSYFVVSGRAIDTAASEAELAFLLVRPLVRAQRIQLSAAKFGKQWPRELDALSEERWEKVLKLQSTKDAPKLDVADEISVDAETNTCLAHSGYSSLAEQTYLKKLANSRELPWAKWVSDNLTGIDYRLERLSEIPTNGQVTNRKRFNQANKTWNMLE